MSIIRINAITVPAQAGDELDAPAKRFDAAALERLLKHDWPGHVRELENLCWRLAVLAPGDTITPRDLAKAMARDEAPGPPAWQQALASEVRARLDRGETGLHAPLREAFDQALLETALEHTGGHRQNAAEVLGLGRNTVTRKLGARPRRGKPPRSP